jgi:hypothetical protein
MNIQDLIEINIDGKYIFKARDIINFYNVSINSILKYEQKYKVIYDAIN